MTVVTRKPLNFSKARRRSGFEARVLDASAARVHQQHGERKATVLGGLTGTVIEVGAGTGANMRYYPSGIHLIAIEPNPHMHARLRSQAEKYSIDMEIRTLRGEQIDVADHTADAVVATLVLCGVDDPHQVVAEVRRVLKPGGTFFFLEHVAAPVGSMTRRVQAVVKRPHRWAFNGCEVDRDTAAVLANAGFSQIDLVEVDTGRSGMYARHQIIGTATA